MIGQAWYVHMSNRAPCISCEVGTPRVLYPVGLILWYIHVQDALRYLMSGHLPPYSSAWLKSTPCAWFEGLLVCEFRDHRYVTPQVKEPTVRRVTLRPTYETLLSDIDEL